jgi:branched-subunit amino acid aminotransferase/4-amino-4-deoxychorismate lyase
MTVFLNGEFMPIEEAKIPVLDRGFIFGAHGAQLARSGHHESLSP